MDNGSLIYISLMSFSTGILLILTILLNVNISPVEQPMIEHCKINSAEYLEYYDSSTFTCSNGATFDRDIIKG